MTGTLNRREALRLAALGGLTPLVNGACRRTKEPSFDWGAHVNDVQNVIKQHAEVCASAYRIAWQETNKLKGQIGLFISRPDAKTFANIREIWKSAFLNYMETEGLRGVATPTDGLHARIQAWPIDPSKLDSVPGKARAGIVNDTANTPKITAEKLAEAHQPATGNVVLGFHALEFIIYGNDLYDDGGGYRAYTEFTTSRSAERRRQLLETLIALLSDDLETLANAWHPAQEGNYRAQFMVKPSPDALQIIFSGLTSACLSGLHGILTRPLASGNEIDEVCRFSDASLEAIRRAVLGMQKTIKGIAPGRTVEGDEKPLLGLIALADSELAGQISAGFDAILADLEPLDQPFDQLIKKDNTTGRAALEKVEKQLQAQGQLLKQAAATVGASGTSAAA